MALFHYLHFRAFAHHTEDPERVKRALVNAAHTDTYEVRQTQVEGSHGNRILILDLESRSNPAAKSLFAALRRDDPAAFAQLDADLDKRVDENLNLYLRLDKQAAYQGRMQVAAGEDAITVRGKYRSFAPKRAAPGAHEFVTELRELFSKLP